MEDTTFITIHDLSEDAHILYCSDSIVDILGHTPDEVVNTSVWDWFLPDDVPFAKVKHKRGVSMDKAAVLAYARIKDRRGNYVACECCFSVVYDVMVCCTSIYRNNESSQKRAMDAPLIRRLFTSSPKDPRYHMLSHLSSKFSLGDEEQTHEPRAALFLNRFTRSLTIMYATSGIEEIVGLTSEEMKGRSFYYCIQEQCLSDAVRCLESAKENDSIAYLRFHFRDPRVDDPPEPSESEEDETMAEVTGSDDETESGNTSGGTGTATGGHSTGTDSSANGQTSSSHNNSGETTSRPSTSSGQLRSHRSVSVPADLELEAVVSCTSDGLVVCLRRARPLIPGAILPNTEPTYGGIFAAPWAIQPVFQPALPRLPPYPLGAQHPANRQVPNPAFLQAIRDVGVFAWGLVGINGCLAEFAKGRPSGESQPPAGLRIWQPPELPPLTKPSVTSSGYGSGTSSSGNDPFGDPGLS